MNITYIIIIYLYHLYHYFLILLDDQFEEKILK